MMATASNKKKGKGGDKKTPKKKSSNSLKKYLAGDSDYQQGLSALKTSWTNYVAGNKRNRTNVKEDFTSVADNLKRQQKVDSSNQASDYASRGLGISGEYAKARADQNDDYSRKGTDALTSKTRNIQQLRSDYGTQRTLQRQNLQQLRLQAIRRRAAKQGITS